MLQTSGEIQLIRQSHFYETSPVDFMEQPFFINNVIEVKTNLSPSELHARSRDVERTLNVQPKVPKGPRTIDLDLLLYHDELVNTDVLHVPHPSICLRKFVLVPLLEIAARAYCPTDKRPFRECLNALKDVSQLVELYHG